MGVRLLIGWLRGCGAGGNFLVVAAVRGLGLGSGRNNERKWIAVTGGVLNVSAPKLVWTRKASPTVACAISASLNLSTIISCLDLVCYP